MKLILIIARALYGRLSICSLIGGILGGLVGFCFGLLQGQETNLALTSSELVKVGLVLAAAAWVVVLFVFGIWLRYGVRNIALPAFVNALLTGVLTVWFCTLIKVPAIATLIGIVTGIVVGYVLCRWCRGRDYVLRTYNG